MSGCADLRHAVLTLSLALAALPARADVFSPGPLSRAHSSLEGLSNCTQCHVAGSRLSNDTCFACHAEIKQRVTSHEGFHGRLAPEELSCNKCHHEHHGRDFPLVDWGPRGQKGFDHAATGFALKGKHQPLSCASCHNEKMLSDPAVRALRAKEPQRTTFLGAASACASCHFDEHRGQESSKCSSCHNEKGWKPAPGFSHANAAFPLEGAHARVECLKCHTKVLDVEPHPKAPLPPRSEVFERFKPVAHTSCTDCHRDPHEGRFGETCTSCHSVASWTTVSATSSKRAFHDQTRFPLRGAHLEVACKACHGPAPGMRARFKGLHFERCTDCHVDAHVGQLGSPPQACDACHTVQAFRPALFDPASHKGFALTGAHAVVACSGCHRADAALEARAQPVRAFVEKRRRHDVVSLTQFHPAGDTGRCDTCHTDVHRGQFAAKVRANGCADCHNVDSFTRVRFDHSRDSSFALTGAHARAECGSCHVADASGTVRYKPLETACASCHADPHAGQFATASSATNATDCARCHVTDDWQRTSFQHRPPFTSFELQGRHAQVECASCHVTVTVAAGVKARKYRGTPSTCATCHVDVHRGAFREVVQ